MRCYVCLTIVAEDDVDSDCSVVMCHALSYDLCQLSIMGFTVPRNVTSFDKAAAQLEAELYLQKKERALSSSGLGVHPDQNSGRGWINIELNS